ncbi:hypothetical protein BJ508DRAFT_414076 [Ascobolus immersus RN42]|uniref:Uncharacterized protein n=1 Tax=Ascobolus immersus RN42 TaxID=1160509 RepID=A0A3N4I993_ASCIM|nr:hypothetical protein BJ508DRAFT_414076 [Ascobolus immersus RN42]
MGISTLGIIGIVCCGAVGLGLVGTVIYLVTKRAQRALNKRNGTAAMRSGSRLDLEKQQHKTTEKALVVPSKIEVASDNESMSVASFNKIPNSSMGDISSAPSGRSTPMAVHSPSNLVTTSTKRAESPCTLPATDATPGSSVAPPGARSVSSLGQSDSSRDDSPAGRAVSPLGRAASPIGRSVSSLGQTDSSRSDSPMGRAVSPLGRAASPLGRPTSPLGRSISPAPLSNSSRNSFIRSDSQGITRPFSVWQTTTPVPVRTPSPPPILPRQPSTDLLQIASGTYKGT